MIAFASSLDQGGPMARSAEDLALLLNVMAGFDARDSTSAANASARTTRASSRSRSRACASACRRNSSPKGAAPDVVKAVEAAIAEYRKLGCEMVEVSLPNMKLSVPVYYVLAPAEASSNLARFDGVRYGYRAPEYTDLTDMYQKTRAAGLRRRGEAPHPDRHLRAVARLLRCLLPPGAEGAPPDRAGFRGSVQALRRDHGADQPDHRVQARREEATTRCRCICHDIYTIAVNLAGLPGMSIPCGFDDEGLPVGLQIIGNYFAEAKMLNVAHQYQLATDWHLRMPPGIDNDE